MQSWLPAPYWPACHRRGPCPSPGGTTITANTTLTSDPSCAGDGITIGAPGVVLASSNRIRGNLASPNTNVAVVLVGDFNVLEGNALLDNIAGVVVIGNQAFANLDGIRVRGAAVVSGNVVFGTIDDGIDFAAGSAFIQGNTATQNGDLGINAAGAFDGGGNRAFANANPLQCVGVVCS